MNGSNDFMPGREQVRGFELSAATPWSDEKIEPSIEATSPCDCASSQQGSLEEAARLPNGRGSESRRVRSNPSEGGPYLVDLGRDRTVGSWWATGRPVLADWGGYPVRMRVGHVYRDEGTYLA